MNLQEQVSTSWAKNREQTKKEGFFIREGIYHYELYHN